MELVGANQDLEERIAVSRLAPMIVETLVGATTELVCAILNMLELIAKFTRRTCMSHLSAPSTVFMDAWANAPMCIPTMVLDHPNSAMSNVLVNVSQLVWDPMKLLG